MTISLVVYKHTLATVRSIIDSVLSSKIVEKFYIVDNSGETGLRSEVEPLDARIEYIPLDNPGFGSAHNVAIHKAMTMGAKLHAVVNPDIYFSEGQLEKIAEFMEMSPEVGLVMPKTLNVDGSLQVNCKLIPSPMNLIGRRFLPHCLIKRMNDRYEMKGADFNKVMDVPYLCGCFMVFNLACLKEVGLFDERFFMYPEDIDISRRIYASRWRAVYYPKAFVTHAHEAASYKNRKMLKIHILNMIKYFNKWGWLFDFARYRINRDVRKKYGVI